MKKSKKLDIQKLLNLTKENEEALKEGYRLQKVQGSATVTVEWQNGGVLKITTSKPRWL